MTFEINETHDPQIRSWVESANAPDTEFPLQNLPFGVFRQRESNAAARVGVRIGDEILDVGKAYDDGLLEDFSTFAIQIAIDCKHPSLNKIARHDAQHLSEFRLCIHKLLRAIGAVEEEDDDAAANEAHQEKIEQLKSCMVHIEAADLLLPAEIGDYTDFYCSIFHASNVGAMFRPDNPLLPNYKYVPIGYHGRASSIVVSGTEITRPHGQTRPDAEAPPVFAPCKNLDYEMEVGFFIGRGNDLGEAVSIEESDQHIFGLCLVNDWSARDIQAWEYQPLGPFLAKSFATSVSPFVVTMEALAPFRAAAFAREEGDPLPLPYLSSAQNQKFGGLDVQLEVYLLTPKMREAGHQPFLLSRSNMRDLYWTIAQMLAHHTSNGCNLNTGDLIATGTISGREKTERGCLLELTWRGKEPIQLPNGETRRFLEDADEIIMRGYCERAGFRRIGFGECRGIIASAK